jgi:GT2 family glycosyltransferase
MNHQALDGMGEVAATEQDTHTAAWRAPEPGRPADVSVIIPTYNRDGLLRQTLASLQAIDLPPGITAEVIICDDGSSDGTWDTARAFAPSLNLRYCYQADHGYRLAAARNMGIRLATGRLVLFLDCGVLCAPDLLAAHLAAHTANAAPACVIGVIHGYLCPADDPVWLQVCAPDERWWTRVQGLEALHDRRLPVWEALDYDLDRSAVPWAHCWGNHFSVPRQALLEVEGFDETFVGWGPEDIDLAYRLHVHGVLVRVCPNARTLHLPHDQSESAGTARQRWRLHARSAGIATELIACFSLAEYPAVFADVQACVREDLIPEYPRLWSSHALRAIAGLLEGRALLAGGGCGQVAAALGCAAMLEPDERKVTWARERYPHLEVRWCAGAQIDEATGSMGTVLVSDYWRAFPERMVRRIFGEATRVGQRAYCLFTPHYCPPTMPGVPAWTIEQLVAALAPDGLRLTAVDVEGPSGVYRLDASTPEQ